MKATLFVAVLAPLLLCASPVLSDELLPPAPLPMTASEIAELPHAEDAWEYKWRSDHEFIVKRVVAQVNPGSSLGFSIIEIHHQTAEFADFALVYPGQEPKPEDRVLTKRMELKTESGDGPFFTFIRSPDP